jgi:hypothetical protein
MAQLVRLGKLVVGGVGFLETPSAAHVALMLAFAWWLLRLNSRRRPTSS